MEGDAADILKNGRSLRFYFYGCGQGQYLHFLPEVQRLLAEGGVLVTDNVLQDGTLLESRFVIPRRDRTIHARIRGLSV